MAKVDDVNAKKSYLAIIISAIVFIGGITTIFFGVYSLMLRTGILIYSTGMIAVPLTIYKIINNGDRR